MTVGALWRAPLCNVTNGGTEQGRGGKGKMRVICPFCRVGAMPNIGKGHKVDSGGFFEGERGQHGNGDGVRVVHRVLYLGYYYTKREFCIIPSDAVHLDGARTGGTGAAGCAHPYVGERGREGVLPHLSVRKNFFGNLFCRADGQAALGLLLIRNGVVTNADF